MLVIITKVIYLKMEQFIKKLDYDNVQQLEGVIQSITYIHNVPRSLILVNTCHISQAKLSKSSRDRNEIVGSNDCVLIINTGMSESYCVWYAQTQVKRLCERGWQRVLL